MNSDEGGRSCFPIRKQESMKTYIVDAFTSEPFKGNPAGVCLLGAEIGSELMLNIAAELGMSETAFVQKSENDTYSIRYFSPRMEIPLCGHATLASTKVLHETTGLTRFFFHTVEGIQLDVRVQDGLITMEFPRYKTSPIEVPAVMLNALGLSDMVAAVYNAETNIILIEIGDPSTLKGLSPDFAELERSYEGINGVLITSPSTDESFDFFSRYFWPWSGTNEDPVTGATHTFLAPYWGERLGKSILRSFQASERTGNMEIELHDDSISIRGKAVVVLEGILRI